MSTKHICSKVHPGQNHNQWIKKTKAEKQKEINKTANKYKITDKGWWYNTDSGKPAILEGTAELYRKKPLKSYLGFSKGGKIKPFRGNHQHN